MPYTKSTYALPFKKKDLIKAVSHPKVHLDNFKHAVDFILPEGAEILAPKAGKVIEIKVDSKEGGIGSKYMNPKYCNYLTIQHNNGEFSQYVHLKHKGALVKVNDKVRQGQPIALCGNTGLSSTPHLHFQIFKLNKTMAGFEALKIRFKERINIDRTPRPISKELEKLLKIKL